MKKARPQTPTKAQGDGAVANHKERAEAIITRPAP